MKTVLTACLLLVAFASASVKYPALYAQMGTPLYQANVKFGHLSGLKELADAIRAYDRRVQEALRLGQQADKGEKSAASKAYLSALRALQVQHDDLIEMTKASLRHAIRQKDYHRFLTLIESGISAFYFQDSLEESVMAFYEEHRDERRSEILEKRLREKREIVHVYSEPVPYKPLAPTFKTPSTSAKAKPQQKEVIIVTRSRCGYCIKAKKFMNRKNITYTEYDASSSTGRNLLNRHNATGVPLIVVGGSTVIRGFDQNRLLRAVGG